MFLSHGKAACQDCGAGMRCSSAAARPSKPSFLSQCREGNSSSSSCKIDAGMIMSLPLLCIGACHGYEQEARGMTAKCTTRQEKRD